MSREGFERHLDGQGSPAERAAFERDAARDPVLAAELALQRRIDAALARRFAPPAGLAEGAGARGRAAGGATGSAAPVRARIWRAAAVAAALLCAVALAFAFWRARRPAEEQVALLPAGDAQAAGSALPGGAVAGGAVAGGAEPAAERASGEAAGLKPRFFVETPDVASLYARLAKLAPVAGGEVGPFDPGALPGPDIDLSSELALRYDACFDLGTPACSLLGPYAAPEWPSATVLVGYCEGEGRTPSLLVVDDQTMLGCGIEPDACGLKPFYKEVNGLAVWEISTRPQPRLLDAVRACRD